MTSEVLQATSTLAVALSSLAAIFSGSCAFLSYRLSRQIQSEVKSDERIIAGVPIHPYLALRDHSLPVIQCTLFNKSKRKTHINYVLALDRHGKRIEATWSDEIDSLGNPQNPCQLIGIVDSCSFFIRRNDGEDFSYALLYISHSFSTTPLTVIFDPGFA